MSHSSPQPDPDAKGFQDLHTLVQAARDLKSEHGENPEYDRALIELIADTTGFGSDGRRQIVERLVLGKHREFEIRGRIVIDYAMGFSEAEALQWFPHVDWHDPERSHAGDMESSMEDAPKQFWDCVEIKRDVVLDMDNQMHKDQGVWAIRDEITAVVEL